MYSVGMLQVSMGEKRKLNLKKALHSMVNMSSIAAILGIILLFLGVQLPEILSDIMTPVGDANIPVSMIVLGIQLGQSNIKEIAFPTMVMIVAIATHEGKNAQLAAEGVALSTMLSIITLPIVTTVLSVYYGV